MSAGVVKEGQIVNVEINGAAPLTGALVNKVIDALDRLEDLGGNAIGAFHIRGSVHAAECSWPGPVDVQLVAKWERALNRVETVRATTITFVEGACSGVALELLLVSDRRLASVDFSMRCLSSGRDLWPGMSVYRLSRQIGESRARQFFLDGAAASAAGCLKLDIIDEIIAEPANGTALTERVLQYATFDDVAVWRRLLHESTSTAFDEALATHLAACDRALRNAAARTRRESAMAARGEDCQDGAATSSR